MEILVIGATGDLGTRLVPALIDAGHTVHGSARSDQKAATLAIQGATPVRIDIFDTRDVERVIRDTGAQAVINIATALPTLGRAPLPWAWLDHHRLRRVAAHAIAHAAVAAGAHTLIQEGVVLGYADGGDEWLNEDSPTYYRGPVAAMPDAINAAQVMDRAGGRGVCLLFGKFYAADVMSHEKYLAVKRGLPVLIGTPDDWVSVLHLDSAVRAVIAALEVPSGTYNVNDYPVTKGEVADAYTQAAGRPTKFYPRIVEKLSAGAEIYGRSQRVSTWRFQDAANWHSSYPDFARLFADAAHEW
jgi:nucleoside-diphosphate-sugar epimerase